MNKVIAISDYWLEQGLIRSSKSTYSSSCFLTKKGRMVINLTCLNKLITKIKFFY